MSGWMFMSMLPAAALLMLHLGVGPFGHAKWNHLHTRWRAANVVLQTVLVALAAVVLIAGITHLLGVWKI